MGSCLLEVCYRAYIPGASYREVHIRAVYEQLHIFRNRDLHARAGYSQLRTPSYVWVTSLLKHLIESFLPELVIGSYIL
jgi:hypothetical protein